jgi:hypothetical protein
MTLRVKVTPRARRTEIAAKMADGTLKIHVAAAPDRGQANEELCSFLARHFSVPRASVEILSGHTATRKLVRVG